MNDETAVLDSNIESNDPFGMSKFSIRRYSVQHFLLVFTINLLLISMTVVAAVQGNVVLLILSAVTLAVVLLKTSLIVRVGLRTIGVEVWIRHLGVGDYDYKIEPRGRDEVSKACLALETLRQNCIKAMQLDLVTQLSDELQERNAELEQALTDLQESQDRIISQQKLAELGEVSSGVAHEMRNPLQFIVNFTAASKEFTVELLEMCAQPEDVDRLEVKELIQTITENLDRIEEHSGRLKNILSAMMIYDRGTGGSFRYVGLNQLLKEQTDLGYRAIQAYEPGFEAKVVMQLAPTIGEVLIIPEDVARMIVNLVMNACQAMAEKRRDTNDEYHPRLIVISKKSGDNVNIFIRDNGTGISEETKSKMYNPFFTTWDTGRNTGLGLSLVWDIVRGHSGSIEARSQIGEGTEIKVILPTDAEQHSTDTAL
ncbi:MAG: ATP-binding protein [Acidimicrobiaceae bacterium]|nr:ATP-binding protein [Acidimicrobiaceae bacterium]